MAKHDYEYYDALGLTYQVLDAYAYDNDSMSIFEFQKTLEVIAFLENITPKDDTQNVFARLLDNALTV